MTSEEARTPAFIVFEQNMAHVGFVQDSLIKGTAEAVPLIQSLQKQIEAIKELGKEEKPPVVEAVVTQLAEISTKYFGGLNFVREWMSVMLMTFLHAYLEESLVGIAVRDADVMARVRKMEAVQVDPRWSHDEARRIWAERALSGTGPKKWFKYFEDEGVKNYGEVAIERPSLRTIGLGNFEIHFITFDTTVVLPFFSATETAPAIVLGPTRKRQRTG
jgi:hypothetical protein